MKRTNSARVSRALVLGFSLILTSFLMGCVSSPEPEVSYPLDALEDEDFAPILKKHTVHFDVIENFETKYQVHITYLTPTFREAMARRYERIFREPLTQVAEASQKTGFFISLFTGNRDLIELDNKDIWSIKLEHGSSKLDPSRIERLRPKERWAPFFPDINQWSQEYLVLFDLPPSGAAGDAPQNPKMFLSLNSPVGSVRSAW